ncbi:hypothetical protein S245_071921 [Arachis hypogaea]|nr:uncharacterized protein DS421_13g444790 [Arachis hypogaea]
MMEVCRNDEHERDKLINSSLDLNKWNHNNLKRHYEKADCAALKEKEHSQGSMEINQEVDSDKTVTYVYWGHYGNEPNEITREDNGLGLTKPNKGGKGTQNWEKDMGLWNGGSNCLSN